MPLMPSDTAIPYVGSSISQSAAMRSGSYWILPAMRRRGANTQPWQVAVLTGDSKNRLSSRIVAAFESGEEARPDYDYYPTSWQSPYIDRRRACGLQLYRSLGIERKDKQAEKAQWSANYRGFDAPVMLCSGWTASCRPAPSSILACFCNPL